MSDWLARWIAGRRTPIEPETVRRAYQRLFASEDGQVVLHHLLDNIFCEVYEGVNPDEAAILNARRTVVAELLANSLPRTEESR